MTPLKIKKKGEMAIDCFKMDALFPPNQISFWDNSLTNSPFLGTDIVYSTKSHQENKSLPLSPAH